MNKKKFSFKLLLSLALVTVLMSAHFLTVAGLAGENNQPKAATTSLKAPRSTDQATLQSALDANPTDVDLDTLFPGHSTKTITLTKALTTSSNVTMKGTGWTFLLDNTAATNAEFRHIIVGYNKKLTLEGVTLKGLAASNIKGGGIAGEYNIPAEVTLKKATLEENYSSKSGGALHVTNLIMENSTVKNNKAVGNGGGIYVTAKMEITKSTISGNTVTEGTNSEWTVQKGGGICFYASGSADSVITGSTIEKNTLPDRMGTQQGGGLYFGDSASNKLTITDSTFDANTAEQGGGMYLYNTKSTLTDVKVKNNVSVKEGGGVLFRKTDMSSSYVDTIHITGGEFTGNTALKGGGLAFGNTDVPAAFITSTVFNNNKATIGGIEWDPNTAEKNQFSKDALNYWEIARKAYKTNIKSITQTSMASNSYAPTNPYNNHDVQTSHKFFVTFAAMGGEWQVEPENASSTTGKESNFDPGCFVDTTYKVDWFANEKILTADGKIPTGYYINNNGTLVWHRVYETIKKDGYYLEGWYKRYDASTKTYSGKFDIKNETLYESVTLFAKWVKIEDKTVTFDSHGGSTVASQKVKTGQKVTKPADPTRDGYKFLGWYKEDSYQTAWKFDSDVVTGNMTLHAKWEKVGTGTQVVTGDNNNIYLYSIILLSSLGVVAVAVFKKRKTKKY